MYKIIIWEKRNRLDDDDDDDRRTRFLRRNNLLEELQKGELNKKNKAHR